MKVRAGDLFVFAAIVAITIVSACSPPPPRDAAPDDPVTPAAEPGRLPPWTIVCDANGRWNYTWDDAKVNPFTAPFSSREQAQEDMEIAKWVRAHPYEPPKLQRYPTDGYRLCNP